MLNVLRISCQRNIRQVRQYHKCIALQTEVASATSATPQESTFVNEAKEPEKEVGSNINRIADEIVTLNLIEVAQLSELLKKRLNLPDAPMMPMGGFVAGGSAANEEEEAEPQVVQTAFTVKLKGFQEGQKVALIKEIKNILPDCNLVQAKKFVENTPAVVKADLSKEEAEEIKKSIEAAGGLVEII